MSEDKLAVTELLYRYAELIDAGDFDAVGQLLARATFAGTRSRRSRKPATFSGDVGRRRDREAVRDDDPSIPRAREHAAHPSSGAQSDRRDQPEISERDSDSQVDVLRHPEHRDGGRCSRSWSAGTFDTFSCDDSGWYFTERRSRSKWSATCRRT